MLRLFEGPASVALGRQIERVIPDRPTADRPSATSSRPSPSPFVQQDLYPVNRVDQVSDEAIEGYATQNYSDDDGGPPGPG